ncbi:hypothetical protein XAP412_330014 [Xanthomonas phaseoli pv. phaseoli]|uniref:Uncharacterized protein n=1 Tax=Xanthomonas campestris pv. phaseoli TaxID=317013 RepID=A0AB38E1X3_XANCH|nr:hypothetical protein XAP6984_390014 [Xanthomonas phaseoli pv. phaseoli]SON84265.1 hypothetical protein XAP412_330014 [Xanthomonas phaseoli pv. phaseoli]SON88639.1 hypothetical protein XAP7430_380014 [Xanthomonas phaseoli pv. phaseoli]SOO27511.1 hypothetical protein XAP6164_1670009 [Xanthomonas phaseoli pv. phaseoli]
MRHCTAAARGGNREWNRESGIGNRRSIAASRRLVCQLATTPQAGDRHSGVLQAARAVGHARGWATFHQFTAYGQRKIPAYRQYKIPSPCGRGVGVRVRGEATRWSRNAALGLSRRLRKHPSTASA